MNPISTFRLAAGLMMAGMLAAPARADGPATPPAAPAAAGQPAGSGSAGPASNGAASAASPPAEDPRDRKIRELQELIADLAKRVRDLEGGPSRPSGGSLQLRQPAPPGQPMPPGEPELPQPVPPGGAPPGPQPVPPGGEGLPQAVPPGGDTTAGTPGASATLLPNISVVGNLQFRAGNKFNVERRGHIGMAEMEFSFQDAFAPAMRYDVFLTAERDDEFRVGIEEAFVTASRLGPGWTGRAGIMRTPFGRFNPTHPHTWFFISPPSAAVAFFGPDGLRSDGAVLEKQFPIPFRDVFARAELGAWRTQSATDGQFGFTGGKAGAISGRLWFGKALNKETDFELGFSRYQGRGPVNGDGRRLLAIDGLDAVYRTYPAADQRLWFQGEAFCHETWMADGVHPRFGAFFFGAWKWSNFWEMGGRVDYTQYPFGFTGTETAGSLWITKFITEQTSLRMQYTHAASPVIDQNDQFYLQLLFGSGPHSHNIQ